MSIARGGPFGLPHRSAAATSLAVGVSSFGAQGTNAHALLSASGAPAVIYIGSGSQPLAWQRSCCYVAPAVQQLLSSCLLPKRSRSGGGSLVFDANLSVPRLAYLLQYTWQRWAHLPSAALLSMTASLLPLLGATTGGDEGSDTAAVTDAAMVAPTMLPLAAAARVAPAMARLKLERCSGAVVATLAEQKVLVAKLSNIAAVALAAVAVAETGGFTSALRAVRALIAAQVASGSAPAMASAETVLEVAPMTEAEVSGYAVHPVLLDACLGQAAAISAASPAATAPHTWLRSVSALLVTGAAACASSSSVAAYYQASGSWLAGSARISAGSQAGPSATILDAVLGEQDMPPASPGPMSATELLTVAEGDAAALAEDEEAAAVPADHPLLQMAEEERLLHLQAQVPPGSCNVLCPPTQQAPTPNTQYPLLCPPPLQVMGEVRTMLGHAVHPDEPLMAAGLDSRGGMELRRTLADSLGLQVRAMWTFCCSSPALETIQLKQTPPTLVCLLHWSSCP